MPIEPVTAPNAEPRRHMVDEAVRRVVVAVPGEVDQSALRRTLETEVAKGPRSLAALVKVSRRMAIDRVARVPGEVRRWC